MSGVSTIVRGDDARASEEALVGGKGAGLARLRALGARVPQWLVVTTRAFDEHTRTIAPLVLRELASLTGLDPASSEGRARIEHASLALSEAVKLAPIAPALATAIDEGMRALGDGPFAVRSSMVGEDSAEHSFAGQFDTLLFQKDAAEVKDALVQCWASAFSVRSLAYRVRAGMDAAAIGRSAMAVVVQKMIDGRVSGVLFTANPVNGRRDEAVITACWGLGEGVVGGACNTDEFVVGEDGRELSAKLADKDVAVVRDASGRGTRESVVPPAERAARCLTPEEVRLVATEGRRIAAALGGAYDIEWTLEGDALHLLQARPITSVLKDANEIAATADTAGPRIVWDNSNIQESYCGVTTPLTFSFALGAYASVYEQTARLVGISETVLDEHAPVLRNMLGLVRGRVYYNINNWYRLLLLLPSFGKNKADMEKMMGLDAPVDFVHDYVLTGGDKLSRAPKMAATAARLIREFARLDRSVEKFLARFESVTSKVDRNAMPTATFSELMVLAEHLKKELIEKWETPIVNDLYVMMASGRLRRILEKSMGDDAPALWNALVAGEDGIESTEPTRALLRMARLVRGSPALAAVVRSAEPKEALRRIREDHPELAAALAHYLDRYGDRTMGELKLETISLREDPSFLVHVMRNYLDRPDLDPDAIATRERAAREEAEARVSNKLGPLARVRFRRALTAARKSIKARENMRLARTRLFGLYRDLYRAVGTHLHAAGRLDSPRDVFYLTVDEIAAYHGGTAVAADLGSIARARIAEYARYEGEELPNRFETIGAVYHGNLFAADAQAPDAASTSDATTSDARSTRTLRGTGCSPGTVEAELRVVTSPHGDLSVNGRILTALRTDPGWGPLFPTASGILVERGSTLSHSAVLARELGIPAVVGVPNLLKLVKDGERARLDGASGIVERLEALP